MRQVPEEVAALIAGKSLTTVVGVIRLVFREELVN